MTQFEFISLIVVGAISLMLSLYHGGRWAESYPRKLGFKWGYFVAYNTSIVWIAVFGIIALDGLLDFKFPNLLVGIFGLSASLCVALFGLKRRLWANIILTLMSLNPLWMAINFIYLRNRLGEFRQEKEEREGREWPQKLKALPVEVKIALLVVVAWTACVSAYVLLFQPYGRRMSEDDAIHMAAVVCVPALIGIGLFQLYKILLR